MDGFDLYKYPHAVPFNTIEVPRKTRFVHGAAFVENGAQIACGSDHGIIYLHSVEQGELLQRLTHGSRRTMIQALDVSNAFDLVRFNNVHENESLTRQFQPTTVI